jgi:hypothetical protein
MTEKQLNVIRNNLVRYCDYLLAPEEVDRLNKLEPWKVRKLVRLFVSYKIDDAIQFMWELKIPNSLPKVLTEKRKELKSRRAWYRKKWAEKLAKEGKPLPAEKKVVVVVKEKPVPAAPPETILVEDEASASTITETPAPAPQAEQQVVIQASTPAPAKQEEEEDDWEKQMLKELGLLS